MSSNVNERLAVADEDCAKAVATRKNIGKKNLTFMSLSILTL